MDSTVSEVSPTMTAERTFDSLLQQIQSSNLNYHLQLSPFSAYISLKKSPIKDKTGVPLPTTSNIPGAYSASVVAALTARNLLLESQLQSLRSDYAAAIDDCDASQERLKIIEIDLKEMAGLKERNEILESKLGALKSEHTKAMTNYAADGVRLKLLEEEVQTKAKTLEDAATNFQVSIDALNVEKGKLQTKIKNQSEHIKTMEVTKNETETNFKKKMSDTWAKLHKEKSNLISDHKKRIKSLKKVINDQTKTVAKLTERLEDIKNNEEHEFSEVAVQASETADNKKPKLIEVAVQTLTVAGWAAFGGMGDSAVWNRVWNNGDAENNSPNVEAVKQITTTATKVTAGGGVTKAEAVDDNTDKVVEGKVGKRLWKGEWRKVVEIRNELGTYYRCTKCEHFRKKKDDMGQACFVVLEHEDKCKGEWW